MFKSRFHSDIPGLLLPYISLCLCLPSLTGYLLIVSISPYTWNCLRIATPTLPSMAGFSFYIFKFSLLSYFNTSHPSVFPASKIIWWLHLLSLSIFGFPPFCFLLLSFSWELRGTVYCLLCCNWEPHPRCSICWWLEVRRQGRCKHYGPISRKFMENGIKRQDYFWYKKCQNPCRQGSSKSSFKIHIVKKLCMDWKI